MATNEVPVAPRPARWRRLTPLVLLLLAGATLATVYWAPIPALGRGQRFSSSLVVVVLTVLLLNAWMLLLSGLRWAVRLGVLALELAAAVFIYLFVYVEFDGDMVPVNIHVRGSQGPGQGLGEQPARPLEPADVASEPTDFPEYRNRLRDGVVQGPPLVRSLDPKQGPVWRQRVGGGYSGFAVAGAPLKDPAALAVDAWSCAAQTPCRSAAAAGPAPYLQGLAEWTITAAMVGTALVTLEQRGSQEAVVCYDGRTGQQVWAHSYPAYFQESLGGDGPRATPTIWGDFVYSLGAAGNLVCLRARTGEPVWQADILEGNKNIHWGMSGSPLVCGSLVIVNPGCQQDSARGRAVLAFDRQTGQEVWHAGDHPAGYGSPMRANLAGQEQIVIFDADGLAGYDAQGKGELWRYAWPGFNGINVAQPLLLPGDRIFISSGYGRGCSLLRVHKQGQGWSVEEVWKTRAMHCKFSNPVLYGDDIYGLDEGTLACVDVATGERVWRGQRYGHGQLLRQDDLLVILSEAGQVALVQANPEAFHELGRVKALKGDKTWNCPALANGRLYVRNSQQMACFDLRSGR
jgi:outer membrane protein assembly factor BamB